LAASIVGPASSNLQYLIDEDDDEDDDDDDDDDAVEVILLVLEDFSDIPLVIAVVSSTTLGRVIGTFVGLVPLTIEGIPSHLIG
jgi:hypothetical protein